MKCKNCFYYEDYDGEEGYCNFMDANVSANDSCCDFEDAEETEGEKEMSEKRLITIDKFRSMCGYCHNFYGHIRCDVNDTDCFGSSCLYFRQLPKPTLADVCGKRELKDMTEEEFEYIHKKFHVYSNKEIENYFKFVKWFVEHGFNVFGEEK